MECQPWMLSCIRLSQPATAAWLATAGGCSCGSGVGSRCWWCWLQCGPQRVKNIRRLVRTAAAARIHTQEQEGNYSLIVNYYLGRPSRAEQSSANHGDGRGRSQRTSRLLCCIRLQPYYKKHQTGSVYPKQAPPVEQLGGCGGGGWV